MFASLAAVLALALPAQSLQTTNEVVLLDGKVMTVDSILSETYQEVRYKKGKAEGSRPADQVREVRHALKGARLEDYTAGLELMAQGDFAGAIGMFENVLADERLQKEKKYAWTQQHALWNEIRALAALGDAPRVVETVDRLLAKVPDTFFYAPALLMKAQALVDMGDVAGARKVYERLADDVAAKGLPERWAREAELGLLILDDSLAPADKQRRLQGLAERNASEYPAVAARARVEVGNAMVAAGDFDGARDFFQSIVESPEADDATQAAAWSGLGDVAYELALRTEDTNRRKALLEEAVMDYLRVAAGYPDAFQLVPRALARAGMALDRLGERKDAQQVARIMLRRYPESPWKAKLFEELRLQG